MREHIELHRGITRASKERVGYTPSQEMAEAPGKIQLVFREIRSTCDVTQIILRVLGANYSNDTAAKSPGAVLLDGTTKVYPV